MNTLAYEKFKRQIEINDLLHEFGLKAVQTFNECHATVLGAAEFAGKQMRLTGEYAEKIAKL